MKITELSKFTFIFFLIVKQPIESWEIRGVFEERAHQLLLLKWLLLDSESFARQSFLSLTIFGESGKRREFVLIKKGASVDKKL